jgi:hypothetical protein
MDSPRRRQWTEISTHVSLERKRLRAPLQLLGGANHIARCTFKSFQ